MTEPIQPRMVEPTPRPFTFGELLDGAFTLYRRNFVTFYAAALIPQIPLVIFWLTAPLWIAPAALGDFEFALGSLAGILLLPYNLFASILVLGALVHAAGRAYAGEAPEIGESLRVGLRRWLAVAGAGVLAAVAVGVGLLFFIVPGIILMAMFFAIAPAVILERRGALAALDRSRHLASGGKGRIIAVMFVAWVITMLPPMAFWAIGGIGVAAGGIVSGAGPEAFMGGWFMGLTQAAGPLVQSLTWPFFVAVTVLLYLDRRARAEAPDLEVAVARLQPEG